MSRLIDLKGKRFGRFVVIRRAANKGLQPTWLCRCDCGMKREVNAYNLRSGRSTSCGCYQRMLTAARNLKHGAAPAGAVTKEYVAWQSAKLRCFRKKRRDYKNYGGRGITMCARWRNSFPAFLADMGICPDPRWSIDRIDPNGNYEPGNCRWASPQTQRSNQRKKAAPLSRPSVGSEFSCRISQSQLRMRRMKTKSPQSRHTRKVSGRKSVGRQKVKMKMKAKAKAQTSERMRKKPSKRIPAPRPAAQAVHQLPAAKLITQPRHAGGAKSADINVRFFTAEQYEGVKKAAAQMTAPESMNRFIVRSALLRADELMGTKLAAGMDTARTGPVAVENAG